MAPAASRVGEDGRTDLAARLPLVCLARLFSFLSLNDLASCLRVCRQWYNALLNENGEVWRRLCHRTVPALALSDPHLLSETATYKAKLRAFLFAWNSNDCSRNGFIKTNGFTFHRNPVAQSTDGVRTKRGVSTGRHAWDIWWDGPLGTVAMIGVASRHAALQTPGYSPLLGSDDQGWGWNLVDNQLLHDGKSLGLYPAVNNPPKYQVGERIRMVLDCDLHLLYFERGCEFLGVAFDQLPPIRLFPCVSAVYGNTEIGMVYLGAPIDG